MKKLKLKSKYPSRKSLEKKLDEQWRVDVRKAWLSKVGPYCAVPTCKNPARDAHHIFSRRARGVRWDVKNGIMLCPYHHTLGVPSAHKCPIDNPLWFNKILLLYYSQSELDYLAYKYHSPAKFSVTDLMVLLKSEEQKSEVPF